MSTEKEAQPQPYKQGRRSYDVLDMEMESIENHVVICHSRYEGIITRLTKIEECFDKMSESIDIKTSTLTKAIIAGAGTIIIGLVSLLVTILLQHIN